MECDARIKEGSCNYRRQQWHWQVEDVVETVRFIMRQPDHVRIPNLMILPKDHNI